LHNRALHIFHPIKFYSLHSIHPNGGFPLWFTPGNATRCQDFAKRKHCSALSCQHFFAKSPPPCALLNNKKKTKNKNKNKNKKTKTTHHRPVKAPWKGKVEPPVGNESRGVHLKTHQLHQIFPILPGTFIMQ